MSNIASVLKNEISRISRRQIRTETDNFKKASNQYRSDIAALKKKVANIERQLKAIEKHFKKTLPAVAVPEDVKSVRYSAKNFAGLRKRLKLSAAQMGAVIGVGAQTVYNWETGKTRPRKEQIAIIAGLRKLGKKEAASLFDR